MHVFKFEQDVVLVWMDAPGSITWSIRVFFATHADWEALSI